MLTVYSHALSMCTQVLQDLSLKSCSSRASLLQLSFVVGEMCGTISSGDRKRERDGTISDEYEAMRPELLKTTEKGSCTYMMCECGCAMNV